MRSPSQKVGKMEVGETGIFKSLRRDNETQNGETGKSKERRINGGTVRRDFAGVERQKMPLGSTHFLDESSLSLLFVEQQE
ncbi:hypothetical protein PM082_016965 [Marasmius tenuissimus]|nr:hypothetical protein PM082_016965 [Marasmius tenuissimus]